MSNRIKETFNRLANEGKSAFIPYTVLGYPNSEASFAIIETLIASGADALELGLPFSDPMADGPLIENASKSVVESGFTTDDALELIARVRNVHPHIPIVLMSYFNLAFARGIDEFISGIKSAGVDGITFVDLPPEEGQHVFACARAAGIAPVMLISPLTSDERFSTILEHADGYLYLVSRAGITGLAEAYDSKLRSMIAKIRSKTQLPVVVGFGISKPSHVRKMLGLGAQGVVVGSKIIDMIRNSGTDELAEVLRALSETSSRNSANTCTYKQAQSVPTSLPQ